MATALLVLNLAACSVILAAALFFYLRAGAPECAGQHYAQIALVLIAVGAFAAAVSGLTQPLHAWEVAFRVGLAMIAARYLLRAWRAYREGGAR